MELKILTKEQEEILRDLNPIGEDQFSKIYPLGFEEMFKYYPMDSNLSEERRIAKRNKTIFLAQDWLQNIEATPKNIYYDEDYNFIGYSFKNYGKLIPFHEYLKNNQNIEEIHNIFVKLSKSLEELHANDIVLSSINNEGIKNAEGLLSNNIFVDKNKEIVLLNMESYTVKGINPDFCSISFMMNNYDNIHQKISIEDYIKNPEFDKETLLLMWFQSIYSNKLHQVKRNINNSFLATCNCKDFRKKLEEYGFPEEAIDDISAIKRPYSSTLYLHEINIRTTQLNKIKNKTKPKIKK